LKNVTDWFIQYIKDNRRGFDDHFPSGRKMDDCRKEHEWNWFKSFLPYLRVEVQTRYDLCQRMMRVRLTEPYNR